jgi:hypothetical protein
MTSSIMRRSSRLVTRASRLASSVAFEDQFETFEDQVETSETKGLPHYLGPDDPSSPFQVSYALPQVKLDTFPVQLSNFGAAKKGTTFVLGVEVVYFS